VALHLEKRGVCIMIEDSCCTYIPNNTTPDEIISKGLQGLTTLSNELAKNSGINDPFTDLIENGLEDGIAGCPQF
jgi:hypothetical protein